jgi:hypothetical protein
LSAYDGDKISAEKSWEHFTSQADCKSVGVMGASHAECTAQDLDIDADGVPYPEHVSIDFSKYVEKEILKKSKSLARNAQERGWIYQSISEA